MIHNDRRPRLLFLTVALACSLSILSPHLSAQVSPEEHAKHHPEQAKGGNEKGGGMTGGGMMGGEGGGMMGGGMGGMMEKMGAPKPKEMYPQLMDLPDLPMEERASIEQEAHQRMMQGTQLLSDGLDELSIAAATDDFQTMQNATAKMREGLAQFESGLAAHRAIAEGKAPRNVALQWFKREMNLLPPATAEPGFRLFGMTLFHTSIMAVLVTFAAAMIWMYFFKMRRAAALMEKLATAAPSTIDSPPRPASSGSPAIVAAAPAVSESPPAAQMARGSATVAADCCAETEAECATEDVSSDRADISTGLLRVARRKLCRLRVARIYQETVDVRTFRLVACHGGALPFSYLPGQFLTLTLPTGEKPIRRSYTISSSPTQGYYCEITVKREDQGAGSRYLHDKVKEGDTLEVQAPSGKFIFTGKEADSIVLISGGVGITPMMSITRALTDMAWHGEIYFIVACRDPEHFIFESELKTLQQRHSNLHLHVAMSRIKEPIDGYQAGRLSKELLAEWVPDPASKLIHICGAPPMMDSTKQMLAELGVPTEKIQIENFGSQQKPLVKAVEREKAGPAAVTETATTVNFATSNKSTQFLPDETILEASERVGVEIDYSCRTGTCGVCRVKLLAGQVTMEVEDGLEPEDKEAGMILACQAKSTDNVVIEA
ncbi:MAG: 2Fe-2S iron-sulfur cluster binding domain-containing protein [Planctomycetaceae bacterium]|nr:2Fe-2S iron-sulfur cluster binding domain-containing protein [Planctomycetaceae bacterium]